MMMGGGFQLFRVSDPIWSLQLRQEISAPSNSTPV